MKTLKFAKFNITPIKYWPVKFVDNLMFCLLHDSWHFILRLRRFNIKLMIKNLCGNGYNYQVVNMLPGYFIIIKYLRTST